MNYKIHGEPKCLVLHGGPGAIGSASGLAKMIGNCVEVYNRGQSIQAQIDEIKHIVDELHLEDLILVGHSWGAWLAYIYAAKYPTKKIVLIGCGAFEESYLNLMNKRRSNNLSEDELNRLQWYFNKLQSNESIDDDDFGYLAAKMDSYDCIDDKEQGLAFDAVGHQKLMDEIRPLRSSGELLNLSKLIESTVVIIHGKQDPHPFEGVLEPFDKVGLSYQHHLLDQCGHSPWIEKHAMDNFYEIIHQVIE